MVRRQADYSVTVQPNHKGGKGTIQVLNLLEESEMYGAGRLCGISVIPVGGSIGRHTHQGDFEVYYILKGKAKVNDDGRESVLGPGDMMCCRDGGSHAIENIGESELRYIALILYIRR